MRRNVVRMVLAACCLAGAYACLADLLGGPGVGDVALSYQGDSILVVNEGLKLPSVYAATIGGSPLSGPRFTFTSSNPAVIALEGDSLSAKGRGRATVIARLVTSVLPQNAPADTVELRVIARGVTLDKSSVTLASLGDTTALVATALDINGKPISPAQTAPVWVVSDTSVIAMVPQSRLVARKNGTSTVRAIVDFDTALAQIVVRQAIADLTIGPGAVRLVSLTEQTALSAVGVDANGNPIPDPALTWESASPGVAAVDASGKVTARGNGSTYVRARSGTVTDSVAVVVDQRATQVVIVPQPVAAITAVGGQRQLGASGVDQLGNTVLDEEPHWSTLTPLIVRVSAEGLVTAVGEGTGRVVASLDAVADTATLVVSNDPASVEVLPASAALSSLGDTLRLSAVVRNARADTISGASITWTTLDPTVLSVLPDGHAIALGVGTGRVVGAVAAASDTTIVTVTNTPAVVSIVPVADTLVSIGETRQPAVDIRNGRGASLSRGTVSWSSDNTAVATVDLSGTVTARGNGVTYVRAYSGTLKDSVEILVDQRATSVAISPDPVPAITTLGGQRQLAASATDGRGNAVTDEQPHWSSLTPAIVQVSTSGLVTAMSEGTGLIAASLDAAADTATIVVSNDPVSIEVLPATAALSSIDDTLVVRAVVRNASGDTIPRATVSWATLDPLVLSVLADGRAIAIGVGTGRVVGTNSGRSDTSSVTVTNTPAVVSIVPVADTLVSIGETRQPAVDIRNGRGASLSRGSVSWSSDNTAVATVDLSGTVTARGNGATYVRAYSGTLKDSLQIIVDQRAASVVISPDPVPAITAIGAQRQLAASATDGRGSAVTDEQPHWSSLSTSIVQVGTGGLVTAMAEGTGRVVASLDGTADTAVVLVSNNPVSIEVLPATATLSSIDDTLLLRAVVRNSSNDTIPGAVVAWSTLDPLVLSVLADGRAIALGVGTGRVVGTTSAGGDTSVVTVTNAPAFISILPDADTLISIGEPYQPPVDVRNSRGAALGRGAVSWSSDNTAVATVDLLGTITARGNGITYVQAYSGTLNDRIQVVVDQRATSVVTSPDPVPAITAIGGQRQLAATATDARGNAVTDEQPHWSSLTSSIVQVTTSGLVTAMGEGTGRIVASMDQAADTAVIMVSNDPVSIEVLPATATLSSLDDVLQMSAVVRNSRNDPIPNAVVAWTTLDAGVLSVLSDGRAIAVGVGTGRVVGTNAAGSDTSVITVSNTAALVSILPDADTLGSIGDSVTPPVDFRNTRGVSLDRNAVTWSSDNTAIATVSSTGIIVARDSGSTLVRATSAVARDSLAVVVTNAPASIVINGTQDTLTALGQSLSYAAEVRNARGNLIADYPVAWRSSNSGVASVTGAGTVTATTISVTPATANVIARAGLVEDTLTVVVLNPTLLQVDNSVVASVRVGTGSRPYLRIQDAVNAADAFDTVLVHRGASPYSETVALSRRITLLGDSTAYVSGLDPLQLPRIGHDSGAAAVTAFTSAQVTIRYFTVVHTLSGPAVDARGGDVSISDLYVNPQGTVLGNIGGGVSIKDSPSGSRVANSVIRQVRGYGIRLENSSSAELNGNSIAAVDSIAGQEPGAGIRVVGGSDDRVQGNSMIETQGPQLLIEGAATPTISANSFAGRHQLVRLDDIVTRASVTDNTFDLRPRATDDARGSADDGRSGLDIEDSDPVDVTGNVFTDSTTAAGSAMDALRLIDQRGANLLRNHFIGGRYQIRSARSTWTVTGSRFEGASKAVVAEETDTLSLVDDTLTAGRSGQCVQATGTNSAATVLRGLFESCPTSGGVALAVSGSGTSLEVTQSTFTGAEARAISFNGHLLKARGNVFSGAGVSAVTYAGAAVISATADVDSIEANAITDYSTFDGISVSGGLVRVDSNLVARNVIGMRLTAGADFRALDNDIYDHQTGGVLNPEVGTLTIPGNWWGDGTNGPRRDAVPAAAGDSAIGNIDFTAVRGTPLSPGSVAVGLRKVHGDNQDSTRNSTLRIPLAVRVVDAAGRPVSGVSVTFSTPTSGARLNGSNNPVSTVTDASGLADVTLKLSSTAGQNTVNVNGTSTSLGTVTFSATGTQ
ncbi:MAG: Ig-like domain-containing protein [Gemmatimonadetes bacterium]|nr:Ig-like domain-containing protein [Gemmatimonadota bacterium]